MYHVLPYNENRKLLVAFDTEYIYTCTFYAAKAYVLCARKYFYVMYIWRKKFKFFSRNLDEMNIEKYSE